MPTISVHDGSLRVELHGIEQFLSFSRGLNIPLSHITGASIDEAVRKDIGWRGAGTGTINFAAGTFIKKGKRQFVYANVKKQTPVVIDLRDEKFHRVILGLDGGRPVAQALIEQLNAR